jgi:arginase family enzyme
MSESFVIQFGAPDAPYCDPETARVTIIPAPLEYSVCAYMQGTKHGPQAILNASSQTEIGIRSFSPEEAEFMKTRPDVAIH